MHQRVLQVAVLLAGIVLIALVVRRHRLHHESVRPADEQAPDAGPPDSPSSDDGRFFVARAIESWGEPDLPRWPHALHDRWSATFSEALCAGEPRAWLHLRALLESAGDAFVDAVPDLVADAARSCLSPHGAAACEIALESIVHGGARARLGWPLLAHCDDETALPLLDRADAPDAAVLRFLVDREALGRPPRRLPEHAPAAVLRAVRGSSRSRSHPSPVELAAALGRHDDPRATEALVALFEAAPAHLRPLIGVAIRHPIDDRSRAIRQESCATSARSSPASACDDDTLAGQVRSPRFDPAWEVARRPETRDEIAAALDSCVRERVVPVAARCLRRLAALDRSRASSLVGALHLATDPSTSEPRARGDGLRWLASVSRELERFPDERAFAAALDGLGIGAAGEGGAVPTTILDALVARGKAYGLDPESRIVPVPHDVLLRRVARLVSPALDDVVFAHGPPDPGAREPGRYELLAFVDDTRFETHTRSVDDTFDVEAVVGLVNLLLVRRGSAERCVEASEIESTDRTFVVCLDVARFRALEDAGLLRPPAAR